MAKKEDAKQVPAEDKKVTALALLQSEVLQKKMAAIAPPKFDIARQFEFGSALAKVLENSQKPVSPRSIVGCMYTATSLGLSLNAVKGEAFLVPFGGVCTFVPGYKGLIRLMRNAGLKDIQAKVVWSDDEGFDYWEDDQGVHYRFKPTNKPKEDRYPEWVVSRAVLPDGTTSCLVVPYHKVDAIKAAALARTQKSPWATHEEEMAQKTAIRMHSKTLPMDDNVATAVHWDEKVEINDRSMELPSDLAEIIGEDEPPAPEANVQQPTTETAEAEEVPPVQTIDQKIEGLKSFLSDNDIEAVYIAVEQVSEKKRSDFSNKEKNMVAKGLEKKLDE